MAPTCRACRHPERLEMDSALVRGVPYWNIMERFGGGLTLGGLARHASAHIHPEVREAAKERRHD